MSLIMEGYAAYYDYEHNGYANDALLVIAVNHAFRCRPNLFTEMLKTYKNIFNESLSIQEITKGNPVLDLNDINVQLFFIRIISKLSDFFNLQNIGAITENILSIKINNIADGTYKSDLLYESTSKSIRVYLFKTNMTEIEKYHIFNLSNYADIEQLKINDIYAEFLLDSTCTLQQLKEGLTQYKAYKPLID